MTFPASALGMIFYPFKCLAVLCIYILKFSHISLLSPLIPLCPYWNSFSQESHSYVHPFLKYVLLKTLILPCGTGSIMTMSVWLICCNRPSKRSLCGTSWTMTYSWWSKKTPCLTFKFLLGIYERHQSWEY